MNTYKLEIGGKVIMVKACSLQAALEKEGFIVRDIHTEYPKLFNGKYIVELGGDYPCTLYATWVEKFEKVKSQNQ